VTYPEPATTIDADITDLTSLTNGESGLFAISQPTPAGQRVRRIVLPEGELMKLSVQTPAIVWPSVRAGKTSGVLSLYISLDRSGHVREMFPLNSDNANLEDAAREQVEKWQFKPVTSGSEPVQVESIVTFAFNTAIENSIPILNDAEARKLVYHAVEPQISRGAAIPRTSFTVRVLVGLDGKVQGGENPYDVPSTIFLAATNCLENWHFLPYLRNGKPDVFKADITFQVQ
jgi:hypothetical protein